MSVLYLEYVKPWPILIAIEYFWSRSRSAWKACQTLKHGAAADRRNKPNESAEAEEGRPRGRGRVQVRYRHVLPQRLLRHLIDALLLELVLHAPRLPRHHLGPVKGRLRERVDLLLFRVHLLEPWTTRINGKMAQSHRSEPVDARYHTHQTNQKSQQAHTRWTAVELGGWHTETSKLSEERAAHEVVEEELKVPLAALEGRLRHKLVIV
eukprot:5848368-Prymnesium_polylepis.2